MFLLVAVVSAVIQHTPGFRLSIGSLSPMLLIPFVVCVAMYERSLTGLVYGVLAGALWDFASTGADGMFTLMLATVGFAVGVTITFYPSTVGNNLCYDLENGCINQWVGQWNRLENLELLYSSVRSTIGDEVVLTSQTYRNSEFTIFIRIGTMGGNDASSQDAVKVYGQFSGTNLAEPYEPYEYTKASAFGAVSTSGVSSYFGYGQIEFEEGMTWEDWINSDYNTMGVKLVDGCIEFPGGGRLLSMYENSQGYHDYASGSEVMVSDDYLLTDEIHSPWD